MLFPECRLYLKKDICLIENIKWRAAKFCLEDILFGLLPLMMMYEINDNFFIKSLCNPLEFFKIKKFVFFWSLIFQIFQKFFNCHCLCWTSKSSESLGQFLIEFWLFIFPIHFTSYALATSALDQLYPSILINSN